MAYPTVSAPYGFKPVNLIGGQVFSGSTRDYPISYNYNTNIFYGDFVQLTSGYVTILANDIAGAAAVGVFLGCYYTNPTTKQRLFSQYYPANTTAGDITAIVCDDPDTVFRAAVTAATTGNTIGSASLEVSLAVVASEGSESPKSSPADFVSPGRLPGLPSWVVGSSS